MMLLHTAPHRVAVAAGRLRSLRSATGLGSAALFALAWGLVFFALVAPASGDEAVTGNPADPAGSSAATAPAPPAALLGQVSSAYGAVIPTTQFLGLDTLGTLYDRIGDETIGTNPGNADVHINAAWGRAFGGYVGAAYGGQAQTRTRDSEVGMQTGLDLYRHITAKGGRDVFGAYFSYASVEVETSGLVTNAAGTDSVMTMTGGNMVNAYSGGLYYTHFDPAGWYADLVGQGTHYSGIAGTGRTLIPLSGYGFATSLELGAPIALRPGLALVPQAQLIWQGVWLASQSDAYGMVQPGAASTLYGRIGAQLNGAMQAGAWQLRPYARANLWAALAGTSSSILYAGVDSIVTKADAAWAQFGLGLTAHRNNSRLNLYAHVDGLVGLKNAGTNRYGFNGGGGLKYEW